MGQFDETLGVLLLGIIFNTYLYGIVSYQFAAYWRTPFNDRPTLKVMVLVLFLLDTVHSAAEIYMAWEYCVTNFNNPSILAEALWPYTFTPPATALAALITHTFLGYRVYRLMNNNIYIYGCILVVASASFTLGVYCGTRAWIIRFAAGFDVLTKPVTAWLSVQAGLDLCITGLLSFALLRSRTGFRKTDTIVNRLIRGAIQTGVFAAVFALGDLVTFIKYPNTNFYGMFAIPVCGNLSLWFVRH
ncbi:hypothetical protein OF83DRAFT_221986 [Amylostereum chailletii]|nr:hypothetical protein OF83DRAFT_221986 [Amylostereum chailletii]